jgi:hypothetical protein
MGMFWWAGFETSDETLTILCWRWLADTKGFKNIRG